MDLLPLHHLWCLLEDGAHSVDGGHAQMGALLVLADYVLDAAEVAQLYLLMGVPTLEMAGFYWHNLCFTTITNIFPLGYWLYAHSLVLNQCNSLLYIYLFLLLRKVENQSSSP